MKIKKNDEAAGFYKEILKRQPKNPVAHANLAAAYAGSGKGQEELNSLKKAAALNPNDPTIRYNLGAESVRLCRAWLCLR
jgi:predicted Zn-dependent protease